MEHLFDKNIFGLDIKVMMQTVDKGINDAGKDTNLAESLAFLEKGRKVKEGAIQKYSNGYWTKTFTTAEIGTVTLAEAASRIVSHTDCHAWQIDLILNTQLKLTTIFDKSASFWCAFFVI